MRSKLQDFRSSNERNVLQLRMNLQTARELGITIPQSVMFRADEVIEYVSHLARKAGRSNAGVEGA